MKGYFYVNINKDMETNDIYDFNYILRDFMPNQDLQGGVNPNNIDDSKDVTFQHINNDSVIEVYTAHVTRPVLSIYEYVGTHTKFAKFILSKKSIKEFIDEIDVYFTINPAEVAFRLLKEKKWDAILDRGYEKVTYSTLEYNEQWENTVERYFQQQHNVITEDILKKYGLKQ